MPKVPPKQTAPPSTNTPMPLAWPPVDVAVAASLLAFDPLALLSEAQRLADAGVDWLHVDIMDGPFVPNLGLSLAATQALVARQPLPIDVHLMVSDPLSYIEPLAQSGVSVITVHAEATPHLHRVVLAMRQAGVRVGVALNPATPLKVLDHVWPEIDLVLLMGVNPGFCHQRFIPQMVDKMAALSDIASVRQPGCVLQVDGGITPDLARTLAQAGARAFVAGGYLSGRRPAGQAAQALRRAAQQGHKQRAAKGARQRP